MSSEIPIRLVLQCPLVIVFRAFIPDASRFYQIEELRGLLKYKNSLACVHYLYIFIMMIYVWCL